MLLILSIIACVVAILRQFDLLIITPEVIFRNCQEPVELLQG
jgi:hypothetical protein